MEATWKEKAEALQARLETIRLERDKLRLRCDEILAQQLVERQQVMRMLKEAREALLEEDILGAPD